MTERIARLEERFDSVLPTLSTKAEYEGTRTDVHKGQSEMKSWTLGTTLALLIGFFTIAVYYGNHISAIVSHGLQQAAKQPITPQPTTPIIIQMPAPAPPTPTEQAPPSVASGPAT